MSIYKKYKYQLWFAYILLKDKYINLNKNIKIYIKMYLLININD